MEERDNGGSNTMGPMHTPAQEISKLLTDTHWYTSKADSHLYVN